VHGAHTAFIRAVFRVLLEFRLVNLQALKNGTEQNAAFFSAMNPLFN
jgi:hypothetical protein